MLSELTSLKNLVRKCYLYMYLNICYLLENLYKLTGIPHVIVEVVLNSMLLIDIFIQTKLQGMTI